MKARAGGAPLVFAVPGKSRAQRFRDAPSVGISEPGQDGPRGRESECVDELFSEKAQRDRVEQEHALARERDDPALLREVKQLVNIEVVGAHGSSRKASQVESRSYQFDSSTRLLQPLSPRKRLKTGPRRSWYWGCHMGLRSDKRA